MARMYIVNHWNDAAAYSGEQIGDRLKDSQALHFNRDGSANVNLYSEETALAKKKTSVALVDRILPQLRTLNKRLEEIRELEAEYKAGLHSPRDYTILRDVAFNKKERAEALYKKAINVAQSRNETLQDSVESGVQNGNGCATTPQQEEIVTGTFLDEISSENSLKLFAQRALQAGRVLVRCMQQAKAYIQTLKEM